MSILDRLADYDEGRIVSFELSESKQEIVLTEECDSYFQITLSKIEFGQMIEELKALHSQMTDAPQSDAAEDGGKK